MTLMLTVEPVDEREFLENLLAPGLYFPAMAGLQLQEHIVVQYISTGKQQDIHCMVVGRCFEGDSTVPKTMKIQALKSQHVHVRSLLDDL